MNSTRILLCVIYLFTFLNSGFAQDPKASNGHAAAGRAVAPPPMIPSLGGLPLEEDAPGEENFKYTHFNEVEGYLNEPCLEPGGAVVSVGTFRALNLAASGKVSNLIQMDYNLGIKLFNMMNIQLINQASDRLDYLSLLLTGERQTELIEQARKEAHSGKLNTKHYMQALKAKFQKDHPNAKGLLSENWKKLGVVLPESGWAKVAEINAKDEIEHFMHGKMFNYLKQTADEDLAKYTIFGNDDRFATIQKMSREGRITIMVGDITGDKSLNSIGKALRQRDIPLAAVDVSNVPDYFASPDAEAEALIKEKKGEEAGGFKAFKAFKGNLDKMPFTDKTRVLVTAVVDHQSDSGLGWSYFALNRKQFPQWEEAYRRIYAASPEGRKKLDSEMRSFLTRDPSSQHSKKPIYTPNGNECK